MGTLQQLKLEASKCHTYAMFSSSNGTERGEKGQKRGEFNGNIFKTF